MKKFLRNIFGYNTSLEDAESILSAECVFSGEKVAEVFGIKKAPSPRINYSVEALKQCAEKNQKGKQRWRLLCRPGLSIQEIVAQKPDFFSRSCILDELPKIITEVSKPKYLLINMRLMQTGKATVFNEWKVPSKSLCARARIGTVVEAIVTARQLFGKHFLETGFHAGELFEKDKEDRIVLVGNNNNKGMLLYSLPTGFRLPPDNVGMLMCRIPGT